MVFACCITSRKRNAILVLYYQVCLIEHRICHLRCFDKKYSNSVSIVCLSVLDGMCWSNPYVSASSSFFVKVYVEKLCIIFF